MSTIGQNIEFDTNQDFNILGYRGGYLSLMFETLTALQFKSKVNIILNETEKRAPAPFETNLTFEEIFYTDLKNPPSGKFIVGVSGPVGKKFLYRFYCDLWNLKPSDFAQLIHPSVIIASTVVKGFGLQIEPLTVVAPYTKIGLNVNISRNCSIGHHVVLHDFCSVFFGSNIAGSVEIGKGSIIGPGSTVFSAVKIGENSIIGGGSVVTKDVPDNVLAFGNPCKVIKELK